MADVFDIAAVGGAASTVCGLDTAQARALAGHIEVLTAAA